jgi:outer membrane autotransporter protein
MSRDRIGSRNDSQSVFGGDTVVNQHAQTRRKGIQVGADRNFGGGVLGVTAGWQKADAEVREAITDVDGKGYNVGAYAILGSATGLYGGLLVKYDRNTLEMDNDVLNAVGKLTSKSVGVEGEFGYRIPIGSSTLDLGAGLAMVRTKIEDFSLANIDYDYRTAKTLRGRLGARFESAVGVFLDTKLFHDFRDDNDLVMRSGSESDTLEANGKGTWFRAELGYGKPGNAGPIGALWVNAGDVHGFGAKLGYRF